MTESNKTGLVIAFVVVIILFLIFGGGMMGGWGNGMMGTGRMMGDGAMGPSGLGGYGWMWIPTVITLGIGIVLGWLIFGKK